MFILIAEEQERLIRSEESFVIVPVLMSSSSDL